MDFVYLQIAALAQSHFSLSLTPGAPRLANAASFKQPKTGVPFWPLGTSPHKKLTNSWPKPNVLLPNSRGRNCGRDIQGVFGSLGRVGRTPRGQPVFWWQTSHFGPSRFGVALWYARGQDNSLLGRSCIVAFSQEHPWARRW